MALQTMEQMTGLRTDVFGSFAKVQLKFLISISSRRTKIEVSHSILDFRNNNSIFVTHFSFAQVYEMAHLSPPPSPSNSLPSVTSKLLNYPNIMNGLDKLNFPLATSAFRANLNTALQNKLSQGK